MKKKTKDVVDIEKVVYYSNAKVKCSCGASFHVGSTKENISVEVCSFCHPFYTGNQKLVDTSGRVDKFKERISKQKEMLKNKSDKSTDKDKQLTKNDLKKKESKHANA
jgi:large subunit ribosomal protein L31